MVLDIGCGDGKITAKLDARVPWGKVLGIDLSSEIVNFASGKYPPEICTNLAFGPGDTNKLDFNEQFDLWSLLHAFIGLMTTFLS